MITTVVKLMTVTRVVMRVSCDFTDIKVLDWRWKLVGLATMNFAMVAA